MANGWGGSRPGSGRKSSIEEGKISTLINKSVELTQKFLDDETIPIHDRVEVAHKLAMKAVPSDVNVAGTLTHNVFLQEIISKSKE